MCTNFVLIKKDSVTRLADRLSVAADNFIYGENFKPGSRISIVTGDPESRAVRPAIWWLYLRQTPEGLKPHPEYFSVNTNHQKLPRKWEYRHSRCLIPATAFVESQDGKRPHLLEPADGSTMALGGLYKEWTDNVTGQQVVSASIITLPGIPALEQIHRKSVPLWLPENAYDTWLDTGVTSPPELDVFLHPTLHVPLLATPIDRVGTKRPTGEPILINPQPD